MRKSAKGSGVQEAGLEVMPVSEAAAEPPVEAGEVLAGGGGGGPVDAETEVLAGKEEPVPKTKAAGRFHRLDERYVEGGAARERRQGPDWGRLEAAAGTGEILRGVVTGVDLDGTVRVLVEGALARMPREEFDNRERPWDNDGLAKFIGLEVLAAVLKADRRLGVVEVSRRAARDRLGREVLARLREGDVVEGVVQGVGQNMAYVDLGGLRAVVPAGEIEHGYTVDARDVLNRGEKIQGKVVRLEPEKRRVTLSLRALRPDPWESVGDILARGQRVLGRVTGVNGGAVFVRLPEVGVDAFAVKRAALSGLKAGQEVRVKVNFVDPKRRKIGVFILGPVDRTA